jgi:hypothetical protein
MSASKAKRGQRCVVYLGDGSTVTGTLTGYRTENAGKWNVARYKLITLDDGTEYATILPAYQRV